MATTQLPPFDLRVIYDWMRPEAVMAARLTGATPQCWLDAAMGPIAAADLLSTTRSSGINLPDAAGVYQSIGVNELPRTDRGLYANGQFVQSAVNWDAPANETISLGTGTFTLAVWGGGSIAVVAGTAAGSGFGTATDGSPVTFTISGAGTISLTVTGSPEYVSVTNTSFAPPAPQPTGTVLASDIRAVQGVRQSNSQPEPFPGWEAEGLDNAFGINASVKIDRLNAASARTIAAVGIDATQLYHVYLDTDNRIKARLRKLGPELRGDGVIGLDGTATAATYNTGTGVGTASRVNVFNQSFVNWSGLTANGTYLIDVENTGSVPMLVRSGNSTAPGAFALPAGNRTVAIVKAAAYGEITICVPGENNSIAFTVHSIREVVTHYTLQSGVISTLGDYDIAAVLNPGSNSLTVSGGVAGDTNASVETLPTGATTLRVGSDFGALNPFNGWIKELQILKVAA